ncbi:DNA-dependent protein kinase catalytic subunit [Oopsacas minuta]|uniref:DNA-dependent protein kinase catalytic subunit n=1 Tax=Oopsacas minuta TaxID=111878 RepID=A0AAV7JD80_9METZ|nr:DNA-dependent protein kinase catalytic subunit [Oopsacas minuta]
MISLDLLLVLLDKKLPLGPQERVQHLLDRCLNTALHESTKLSSGARGSLYELLGKLAECYYLLATTIEDRLVTLFLGVLKSQMDSKKGPDMPVIAGCLRGLTHYLRSFSKSAEEGSRYAKDIYSYARKAADPQVPLTRYEVQRAGLKLLAQHGAQFRPFLVADYQATFLFLLQLLDHNNKELKHDGLSALESFLYQISQHFLEAPDTDQALCKSLLMYFIKQFRNILHDLSSSTKKVGISVRGYGYFASACSHFLKPKEVETLVNEIVRRSDKLLIIQNEDSASERVYQLPSFLEAFASIAKELGCVNQSFGTCLEQLIIMLFEFFPRIIPKHQKPAFTSLSRALLSLISSQTMLKKLLQNIIYQGLLFTCTHALPSQILPLEATSEPENEGDLLLPARDSTYQDFLPLWLNLIDPQRTPTVAVLLLDFPNAEGMYRVIYDEVIHAILLILDKLDLSTESTTSTQDSELTNSLDDLTTLQPKNPNEYQFFLNLVDFTGELLPSAQLEMFSHWVLPFGRMLIILSHTYPHVSGFLKLLTTCMSVCRKLKYFDNEDRMEIEQETLHFDAFILFKKFLSEQLLTLSQLKGEMLAASLHLILSFPIQIVERDFPAVIPAIKKAFEVGLSHLPLAETALDTLEEWLLTLQSDVILKHIPDILPALNDYLTTSADAGAESLSNERALITALSGSKRFSKMSAKQLRTADTKSEVRDLSSQLSKIRHRIVLFLGSLGGQTNSFLISRGPNPHLISWDTSLHLKYMIPFQDIKPVIYLDPFLPRVIDLALHSSDRQSKVCACELLHAITIYMIGYSATQPDTVKKRSPQRRLYSHIFPAMLKLGCDVEEVSVQLFRPLTLQTIHWFTGNKTFESPDTIELLNAILSGLEDTSNTALRDFSAVCVKEFLAWSIKQTSKKQQEQSSGNAKSLLKRLYSMALHPNAFRRLGAALAFNKLYTVFREEAVLVNIFTIETLITYLSSLRQSHRDSEFLGIQTEIQKVISHLERIIHAKRTQFNQVSKDRKTPKGLKVATLHGIVSFALSNVGSTETAFRESCMHLFCEFSPLVSDSKTPVEWVEKEIIENEKGIGYFTTRFERGGSDSRGILKNSVLKGTQFSLRAVEIWLESLIAALDCYCWIFKKKLFTPTQLFTAKTEPNSMLFESIGFFCSSLAFSDIVACTTCFESTSTTSFTPRETDLFNNLRSLVVVKLIQLLSALLKNFSNHLHAIPLAFWSERLMTVVLVSILCPSKLGFNTGNLTLANKLSQYTMETCQAMMDCLSVEAKVVLAETTEKVLSSQEYDISQNLSIEEDNVSSLITLINGYIQLYNTGLYSQYEKTPSELPNRIINLVISLVTLTDNSVFVSLSPQQVTLAGLLVNFASKLGANKEEFLEKILSLNTNSTNGEVVYSLFSKHINQIILSDCYTHLSTILNANTSANNLVVLCLNSLLDYSIREKLDKRVDCKVNNDLVPSFLELWPSLKDWYSPKASQDSKTCFLTIFNKFTRLLSTNVFNEYPKSHCLLDSFAQLIGDADTLPTFRSQCLSLVPFFLAACMGKQEFRGKLKSALSDYIQSNFPLYSTELAVGSTAREEYITAIDRMLAAMGSNPDSTLMLEVLLPVVCRQEKHIYGVTILGAYQDFIEKASPLIAKNALDLYFQIYSDEGSYNDTTRKSAALGFTIPMLTYASDACFREFYESHIVSLMKIVEGKPCRQSDPHFQSQLISKLCAFEFIEKLYIRLPCNDLSSMDSKLNTLYCNGTPKNGKELTQAATKSAHAAKSEDHRGESFNVIRLEYHQSAYKLICSIITCTQTKMAFYSTFLFKEDIIKGSMLWDNIINTDVNLVFPVMLDNPMEQSHKLTTIRSNFKSGSADNTPPMSPPPVDKYLSSLYLSQTSSSLVSDLSQYDFSMSSSFFSFKKRLRYQHKPKPQGMYVVSEEKLELDYINRNPCMHAILRVLDYMEHNKINPDPPSNPSSPSDLPQWMLILHTKLTEGSTHTNIRLFIAKIVINRPQVFQPYARLWTEPLVQIILLQCNENKGMNYFIVDLTVTVLSWAQTYVFEDTFLASKLLEGLMTNTHTEERSVLRNNLSIVRTLVECWKKNLNMPYSVMQGYFSNRNLNGKMQRTGVQLMGIVLANDIPPYGEIYVSEAKFYESFLYCIEHRLKEVYAPAAEVTGMLLKFIKEAGKFDIDLLTKWTEERMSGILSAQNQPTKFVECLYKIHINFPEFCDRFLNRILFLLPSLKDDARNFVIDIITSRADSVADLKMQLKTKDFYSILRVKDSKTQISAIRLALKIVPCMDEIEFSALIDTLEYIYPNTSSESREMCYEFMMALFDQKADQEKSTVRDRAKSFLLRGLLDSSESNRLKVFAFWNNEAHLPSETVQRLIQILSLLYSEATEDQFLSYSTNFFLELASRSPDYLLEMFHHPLAECKFEAQKLLDYSYSYRQSGFLPLFANTLPSLMASQSQVQSQDPQPMETETSEAGELRSTIQPIAFTPTLDPGTQSEHKYNWLAPSLQSQQLFNPTIMDTDSESSLLFTGFKIPKRMKQIGSSGVATLSTDSPSHPVMQLKRRFLKSQQSSTVFYQKQSVRKRKLREEYFKFQKASRGNKVVMYRQYRTGDLPDIQIKNSELIRPLQALAQRDDKIARLLFSTLFTSIFSDLNKYLSVHEIDVTKKKVQVTINGILKTTQRYSPTFIASIMDISLKQDSSLHFYLEPTLVSTSCLVSCQQLAGIMVLENQLLQGAGECTESSRGSKRSKGAMQAPTEETSIWIELGRLYKSIEDFDTLRGIFGSQIGTQELTKRGIEAEETNNYLGAYKIYKNALEHAEEGTASQEEQDLWEDSLMGCLENLGKWKELESNILSSMSEEDDPYTDLMQVWNDDYYVERHLPRLMKTKVKLQIAGRKDNSFDQFIKNSFQNDLHRSILETHYSEQLALYYLVKNNVDRAKHYVQYTVQNFAQVWSSLPDFQPYSKAGKLQTLQRLVEMNEFINFVSDRENYLNTDNLDRLLRRWHNRLPDKKMDPLSVWSDVITNRSFYLQTILEKYEISEKIDLVESQLTNEVLSSYLSIAEAASTQANFSLAAHFIKQVEGQTDSSAFLKVRCAHITADMCLRRERAQVVPSTEDVSQIVANLGYLQEIKTQYVSTLSEDLLLSSHHHMVEGHQTKRIAELLQEPEGGHLIGSLLTDSFQALKNYLGYIELTTGENPNQIAKKLYMKSLAAFKQAVTDSTNFFKASGEKGSFSIIDSMLAMAKFCDNCLRKEEEGTPTRLDLKQFPSVISNYLLRAMQYGSLEARQLFPRLLQLIDTHPEIRDDFIKKSRVVPNWMFIQWLSQLVSILDKPEGAAVFNILISVATNYPQALYYPLKVSASQYKFPSTPDGNRLQRSVASLQARVDNPVLTMFCAALEQLTNPELVWRDLIEQELSLVMERATSQRDKKMLVTIWDEIKGKLIEEDSQQSTGSDAGSLCGNTPKEWGQRYKAFSKEFGNKILQMFGNQGEKLYSMTSKDFTANKGKIYDLMKTSLFKSQGSSNLKEYSPWLANFHKEDYHKHIEVPGQYDGLSRPRPESHACIASFDSRILVLSSLRKPKRITVRADNEREYSFLIKGGEDLRQDQRIEQLFSIMNQILDQDQACAQRNMRLRTYQVIPMTTRLGVLEWMDNTSPLKEFLKDSATEQDTKAMEQVMQTHVSWVDKFGKYKGMYQKATRTQAIEEYNKKVGNMPWDLLRRSLYRVSSCPEAFLVLRTHFVQSLSSVNICQYIIGIGDRHLSNFMVDLKTGRLIGIDFGHAFGSATQFLPYPELMPFRLTPQFASLMFPHKDSGLLRSCMQHALRSLRESPELLLSTMDIFVKEPSLDWQQNARAQAKKQGENVNIEDKFPKQKVDTARQKLLGYNPAYVMLTDLKLGHEKSVEFSALKRILMGESRDNIRARVGEKCSSVNEQIACLIDHATDPNILGRTWHGWEPWV